MNKKNSIFIGITMVIIIALFVLLYPYVSKRFFDDQLVLYKQSEYDNCSKVKYSGAKQTILTSLDNIKIDDIDIDLSMYQESLCVGLKAKVIRKYYTFNDQYIIQHHKNINDMTYQFSYEKILDVLKNKDNMDELDSKVIDALSFYLDNENNSLLAKSNGDYRLNDKVIGPLASDEEGEYHLVMDLNVIENLNTKSNKKSYYFDSINLRYIKVGGLNE